MTSPIQTPDQHKRFHLRPFADTDYAAASALYREHDIEFMGESNFTEEVMRADWEHAHEFDPARAVRVAETVDGEIVGLVVLQDNQAVPVRPSVWVMAKPAWNDDVLPPMLDWATEKAHEVMDRVPENARVVLQFTTNKDNHRVRKHFTARGMTTERCFYSMLIRFDGPPPAPVVPDGFRVVTYRDYPDLKAFAHACREGFLDHRGASELTPLEWHLERYRKLVEGPDFDPSLWWLALDAEGEPAGLSVTEPESDEWQDVAYVWQLAVLPAYRRKGLALALLQISFQEYYNRGKKGVSLGVDGSSLTNAVALYERAGMSVAAQWDTYELELRPGVELTKQ